MAEPELHTANRESERLEWKKSVQTLIKLPLKLWEKCVLCSLHCRYGSAMPPHSLAFIFIQFINLFFKPISFGRSADIDGGGIASTSTAHFIILWSTSVLEGAHACSAFEFNYTAFVVPDTQRGRRERKIQMRCGNACIECSFHCHFAESTESVVVVTIANK